MRDVSLLPSELIERIGEVIRRKNGFSVEFNGVNGRIETFKVTEHGRLDHKSGSGDNTRNTQQQTRTSSK